MSKRNENFLALIIAVAILGLIFFLPRNWPETTKMGVLVSIPLTFLFFVTYILAPIRLRRNHWVSTHSEFELINPVREVVPEEVWTNIREAIASLSPCGFKAVGHFRKIDLVPGAMSYVTFLESADHFTVANLITVFVTNRKGVHANATLGFRSESPDGTEFVTGNNTILGGTPRRKNRVSLWMPEIQNPGELYEFHQRLVNAFCPVPKEFSLDGNPGQHMNKYSSAEIAYWVDKGYFKLDATGEVYRLTWKGAVLVAWKHLWPIKPLRRAWRKHQTHKLLRKLEE
jgi:hypothetical protein